MEKGDQVGPDSVIMETSIASWPHLENLETYREYVNQVANLPQHRDVPVVYRMHSMKHFLPRPGWRLLDMGGYMGATLFHYALLGHQIEGIEAADHCVRRYEGELEMMPELRGRITMHHCLIEEFEPEGLFDGVICGGIPNLVRDPGVLFAKARECCREGGHFFVTTPASKGRTHVRFLVPMDLHCLMEESGFSVIKELTTQPLPGEPAVAHHICESEAI